MAAEDYDPLFPTDEGSVMDLDCIPLPGQNAKYSLFDDIPYPSEQPRTKKEAAHIVKGIKSHSINQSGGSNKVQLLIKSKREKLIPQTTSSNLPDENDQKKRTQLMFGIGKSRVLTTSGEKLKFSVLKTKKPVNIFEEDDNNDISNSQDLLENGVAKGMSAEAGSCLQKKTDVIVKSGKEHTQGPDVKEVAPKPVSSVTYPSPSIKQSAINTATSVIETQRLSDNQLNYDRKMNPSVSNKRSTVKESYEADSTIPDDKSVYKTESNLSANDLCKMDNQTSVSKKSKENTESPHKSHDEKRRRSKSFSDQELPSSSEPRSKAKKSRQRSISQSSDKKHKRRRSHTRSRTRSRTRSKSRERPLHSTSRQSSYHHGRSNEGYYKKKSYFSSYNKDKTKYRDDHRKADNRRISCHEKSPPRKHYSSSSSEKRSKVSLSRRSHSPKKFTDSVKDSGKLEIKEKVTDQLVNSHAVTDHFPFSKLDPSLAAEIQSKTDKPIKLDTKGESKSKLLESRENNKPEASNRAKQVQEDDNVQEKRVKDNLEKRTNLRHKIKPKSKVSSEKPKQETPKSSGDSTMEETTELNPPPPPPPMLPPPPPPPVSLAFESSTKLEVPPGFSVQYVLTADGQLCQIAMPQYSPQSIAMQPTISLQQPISLQSSLQQSLGMQTPIAIHPNILQQLGMPQVAGVSHPLGVQPIVPVPQNIGLQQNVAMMSSGSIQHMAGATQSSLLQQTVAVPQPISIQQNTDLPRVTGIQQDSRLPPPIGVPFGQNSAPTRSDHPATSNVVSTPSAQPEPRSSLPAPPPPPSFISSSVIPPVGGTATKHYQKEEPHYHEEWDNEEWDDEEWGNEEPDHSYPEYPEYEEPVDDEHYDEYDDYYDDYPEEYDRPHPYVYDHPPHDIYRRRRLPYPYGAGDYDERWDESPERRAAYDDVMYERYYYHERHPRHFIHDQRDFIRRRWDDHPFHSLHRSELVRDHAHIADDDDDDYGYEDDVDDVQEKPKVVSLLDLDVKWHTVPKTNLGSSQNEKVDDLIRKDSFAAKADTTLKSEHIIKERSDTSNQLHTGLSTERKESILKSAKPDEKLVDDQTPDLSSNNVAKDDVDKLVDDKPSHSEQKIRCSSTTKELELKKPSGPPYFEQIEDNFYLKNSSKKTSKNGKDAKKMVCDCTISEEEVAQNIPACGDDCLNRMLMIECSSRCVCGDFCTNKRFQRHQYSPAEIFLTENKGYGLRALSLIPKGAFIREYVGEVLGLKDFKHRVKQYEKVQNKHFYFMALNADEIIDATQKGNISRFINHSCDPNAETQKWTVNGKLRIGFFAVRTIDLGEEITFDYQFERYGKEAQKCYCGAANCRGVIGGEKTQAFKSITIEKPVNKKQSKKDEAKKKEYEFNVDAPCDEVEKLSILGGLKRSEHVLQLCRLMVRAENTEQISQLAETLLVTSNQSCLRLFLSYHGLSLLWSWMVGLPGVGCYALKLMIINILRRLPISNKNIIQETKVLAVVERWIKIAKEQISKLAIEPGTNKNPGSAEIDNEANIMEIKQEPVLQGLPTQPSKFENLSDMENKVELMQADEPGDKKSVLVGSSNENSDNKDSTSQLHNIKYDVKQENSGQPELESRTMNVNDIGTTELLMDIEKHEQDISDHVKEAEFIKKEDKTQDADETPVTAEEESQDGCLSQDENVTESVPVTNRQNSDNTIEDLEHLVKEIEELLTDWSQLKESFKIPKKQQDEERKRTVHEIDTVKNDENVDNKKEKKDLLRSKQMKLLEKKGKRQSTPDQKKNKRQEDHNSPSEKPTLTKEERRRMFEQQVKAEEEHQMQKKQQQQQKHNPQQQTDSSQKIQPQGPPNSANVSQAAVNQVPPDSSQPCSGSTSSNQTSSEKPASYEVSQEPQASIQPTSLSLTAPNAQVTTPGTLSGAVPVPTQAPTVCYYATPQGLVLQHILPASNTQQNQTQMYYVAATASLPSESRNVPLPPPAPSNNTEPTLPLNWKSAKDSEGRTYYYHRVTRQTQWEVPTSTEEESAEMDLESPPNESKKLKPKHSKQKATMAAADTSADSKKIREHFKSAISVHIRSLLNSYMKSDCKIGKITNKDDYKFLAKKLTHAVLDKELKHCKHHEDLEVNENVKFKAKEFVKKYMAKTGSVYKREKDEKHKSPKS